METLKPRTVENQNDKSLFYPIHVNSKKDLRYYYKKFYCFDYEKLKETSTLPDEIEIQGDYNSVKARHLKLMFEKCDPTERTTCKSELEISEWMRRKYIVILENQARFDNSAYIEHPQ